MVNLHVDKPIQNSEEDLLGREKFIHALVNSITSYQDKESLTIGLYGKWGTGKTSIINLATKELEKLDYKVINFNPWNFKDTDELLQCFFKEFYMQLDMVNYHKLFTKLGNFFKKLGSVLSFGKYVPIISPYATIIAPLVKDYGEALNNLTYGKSLEDIKNKISKALTKLNKKIIVFIDDVDRLSDKEICQIFQLVKLVGNFENVVYILSMDKSVVVSALHNSQKEHATAYLEKIVQLPLTLPYFPPIKVQETLAKSLNNIGSQLNEFLPSRNNDLYRTGFWNQFITLRDTYRFLNVFHLKFDSLKSVVDIHDFCILTLFELKYPQIYSFVYQNKNLLCGNFSLYGHGDREKKEVHDAVTSILENAKGIYNTEDCQFIQEALCFLFPKVSKSFNALWGYGEYHHKEEQMRCFLRVEENFSNYFQFYDNGQVYENSDIPNIIENYDHDQFLVFLSLLNNNKQLSQFLPYLSYYIEHKLTETRSKVVLNWIIEFSDNLQKENADDTAFSLDCEDQIVYLIKNYLKHNQSINAYEFIHKIYESGCVNLTKVELLRSLQDDNTKAIEDAKQVQSFLTISEIKNIQDLIKEDLVKYVTNYNNFNKPKYIQFYYLMKSIDVDVCKKLAEQILSEETHLLNFIKNFCTRGRYLTGAGEKTYFFDNTLSNEINIDKIYEIFAKDFNFDINIENEDDFYRVVFIMSYEKYNYNDGEHYTMTTVKNYLKTKRK